MRARTFVTLNLRDEIPAGDRAELAARAAARGLTPAEYLRVLFFGEGRMRPSARRNGEGSAAGDATAGDIDATDRTGATAAGSAFGNNANDTRAAAA